LGGQETAGKKSWPQKDLGEFNLRRKENYKKKAFRLTKPRGARPAHANRSESRKLGLKKRLFRPAKGGEKYRRTPTRRGTTLANSCLTHNQRKEVKKKRPWEEGKRGINHPQKGTWPARVADDRPPINEKTW